MRRLSSPFLAAAALAAAAVALSPAVDAAAQRTFVASYGLTANTAFNCSIAKPCRAFSEAIGVTNPGGEVVVLDSAGYGPVTIAKSVSIVAPAGIYAGITVSSGAGVTINAGAGAIVVLRGLSINGQGGNRGIFVQAAARVRIENCIVSGMAIAGISHTATGAEMIVVDTIVRDNASSGIVVEGDLASVVLDHVRSMHNGGDGFNFATTVGSLGARATVVDSVFTHNEGKGIGAGAVFGATATLLVERSVMSNNGQDGFAAVGVTVTDMNAMLTRNAINDNGGHGILVRDGLGAASENAVHRNSGIGLLVEGSGRVGIAANTFAWNLGGADISCTAPAVIASLGNSIATSAGFGGSCYSKGDINGY
jgi:hypothetical protein